jgi:hypothetical protein
MLTLVSKFRLKTLKKGYKRFGKGLVIKDAKGNKLASFPDVSFKGPKLFLVSHEDPLKSLDRLTRSFIRTVKVMKSECNVCGSNDDLKMHHVQHLKKNDSKNT